MTGFLDGAVIESSSGIDTGDIGYSLRCRSAASAYLSKTITTDATSTYFAAVKRGKLGVISPIFDTNIKFNANDTLTAFGLTTTAVFRDPTSWLFIHVSNGGLYINGVSYGAVTTSALTNPRIGYDGTNYFDGYIARIGCVAGSSSAYTNFGEFNTTINEWVSLSQSAVKAVVDAGGTNSFMLDFDDATSLTTLGYDKSTKGNNWTLNNFSLTAGTTYDHMLDVPGNSFATLNPLKVQGTPTLADGNLSHTRTAVTSRSPGAISIGASDLAYFEFVRTDAVGVANNVAFGIAATDAALSTSTYGGSPTSSGATANEWVLTDRGYACNGSTYTNLTATLGTFGQNDVGRVAVNRVTGKVWFGKNATWSGDPAAGTGEAFSNVTVDVQPLSYVYSGTLHFNTGQRPLAQTAPTGFKALCQANLPDPAILNPEDHHVDIAVTKSGDTNFTLPWSADTYDTFFEIKRRNSTGDWYQIDGLRGYDNILKSNSTAAETTDANVLGISGTTGTLKSTLADGTYIISATKAGLSASRQTNTDGSITSTVSRNVDSGFSIVTYTGTGANATVGHGQGKVVKTLIVKHRNGSTYSWTVQHANVAVGSVLALEANSAAFSRPTAFNSTYPTSSVFSLGTDLGTNANTNTYVAYCYADSAIQKSFSYTGNASTDGAYADVGFKMGRALLKCSTTTGNWTVLDSVRSDSNVADDVIYENLTNAEATSALADLNSHAIKFRITTDPNSAQTFVGHAWAAVTGKYSLGR